MIVTLKICENICSIFGSHSKAFWSKVWPNGFSHTMRLILILIVHFIKVKKSIGEYEFKYIMTHCNILDTINEISPHSINDAIVFAASKGYL